MYEEERRGPARGRPSSSVLRTVRGWPKKFYMDRLSGEILPANEVSVSYRRQHAENLQEVLVCYGSKIHKYDIYKYWDETDQKWSGRALEREKDVPEEDEILVANMADEYEAEIRRREEEDERRKRRIWEFGKDIGFW